MNCLIRISTAGIVLFLIACNTTAKVKIEARDVMALETGSTTRTAVVEKYGEPQKESISGENLNYCYMSPESYDWLFVQFDKKDNLVNRNFNDNTAKEECAPKNTRSTRIMRESNLSGGRNCHIYDGNDQYGRPIYRCP